MLDVNELALETVGQYVVYVIIFPDSFVEVIVVTPVVAIVSEQLFLEHEVMVTIVVEISLKVVLFDDNGQ